MKYVKQVGIIWGFTMAGELLHAILPLPVPSGVYGLFLLLGALMAGWVRLESVEGTGNFLMDTMTMCIRDRIYTIWQTENVQSWLMGSYLI